MKKFLCSVLLCGIAAIPAIAQGGAATSGTPAAIAPQAPASVTADSLSTFVKGAFKSNSNNLIGSAEQMPEANYNIEDWHDDGSAHVRVNAGTHYQRQLSFLRTSQG
jgi:hypothetical protein